MAEAYEPGPACSHGTVVYVPIPHADGTKTERWACAACGSEFSRRARLDESQRRNLSLAGQVERMRDALNLVLLFHGGGEWGVEARAQWRAVTGGDDATTRALCDHIRQTIASLA